MLCRNRGKERRQKSVESVKTVSTSDWLDPVEPSTSLLDQPAQHQATGDSEDAQPLKPVVVGSGKVISPEQLRQQLATISTRDDAHRMISPPPRFDYRPSHLI